MKIKPKNIGRLFLFVIVFLGASLSLGAHQAFAATLHPAASGNWSIGTTWDSGVAPTATDDVVLDNDYNVTVDTITSVAKTVTQSSSGTLTITNAMKLSVSGSVTLASGKFTAGGSTANLTMFTTGTLISAGNTLGSLTWNGASSTFTLGDNLTLSGNFTLTAGTPDFSTYTVSMTAASPTFAGGGKTYSGTISYGGAGGTLTITGVNTFHNLSFDASALASSAIILSLGANQTIDATGTLTLKGHTTDSRYRLLLASNTYGTNRTITLTSGATLAVQSIDFRDIGFNSLQDLSSIIGLSGDCGGNSNITFTTRQDNYWVADTGSWSTTSKWKLSDHTTAGRVPLPQDDAIFDASSFTGTGKTVTADMQRLGRNIDFSAITVGRNPALAGNLTMELYGNFILKPSMTWTITTTLNLAGRSSFTLNTANISRATAININAPSGTYTLGNHINGGGIFSLNYGTFDANDFNVTISRLYILSGVTCNMGNGTWTVSSNIITINTSSNINAEGSTIVSTYVGSSTATFNLGGKTYYEITFSGTKATGPTIISGNNTFNNFTSLSQRLFTMTAGSTQTINGTWNVNGTDSTHKAVFTSSIPGTYWNLYKTSGVVSSDYLDLSDSNATGFGSWYAGVNSSNTNNNSGWIFTVPSSGSACQSNVANGNWNDGTSWINCSGEGGIPANGDIVNILAGHTITLDTTTPTVTSLLIYGTLDTSSSNYALNANKIYIGSAGILLANSSTITLSNTSSLFYKELTGTFTKGSSTVIFNPDSAITLTGGSVITFNNLTLSPTLTSSRTYTFGSDLITISGNFDINPNGGGTARILTVNLGAGGLTVNGTFTLEGTNSGTTTLDTTASNYPLTFNTVTIDSGSTLNTRGSVVNITGTTGTLITNTGTWTTQVSPSTTTLSGNGDIVVNSNALNFYNLTSSGTGIKTLGVNTTIGGTLNATNGTFIFISNNWMKYSTPILNPGSSGSWDSGGVTDSCVIKDGDTYKMWYLGVMGNQRGIGYATSPDGITWTKYSGNPVLLQGTPGSYDGYLWEARVIHDGDTYKMWYQSSVSGAGIFYTNYATSPDGITWTKYSGNPVLSPTPGEWDSQYLGGRDIVKIGDIYHLWYETSTTVGHEGYATSPDGINWTKYAGNPVLISFPGEWDYGNDIPNVVLMNDGSYRNYYSLNYGPPSKVGLATSSDGITWTKSADNPIIDLVSVNPFGLGVWDYNSWQDLIDIIQPDDSNKLYGYYRARNKNNGNNWSIGLITNLILESRTDNNSTTLSINSFLDYTTGSSGYYFYRIEDPTYNSGWIHTNTWTDTGLTANTPYTYYVKYRNADGVELAYATMDSPVYTLSSSNPLTANVITRNSITLSWTGDSTTYYLENTTKNTNSDWISSSPYTFSDLSCGINYSFRIKGKNASGISTDWTTINVTTSNCPSSGSTLAYRTNYIAQQQALAIPAITLPILGCDNRNTGFSITTGNSCVGNPGTPNPSLSSEPSAYNFGTTTLRNGNTGEAVKELQKFLNLKLNLYLVVDGIFGPKTKAAVILFQKAHGLVPDGIVGPLTKAKMQ